MAEALERGVSVALQPIIDLDSGDVVGVEALARFPDGRPPDEWFDEAASVGLGEALEVAAVRGALDRLSELPPNTRLSVNVSATTACSQALAGALTGAPPGRIVLEITERTPVADYPALATALEGFRSRGVRVAVDDAGAGFASMQHVLRLRPDVIKLDVSIVRGIDSEHGRRAFVAALVSFARQTGCSLVAEGIETKSELEVTRALGVGCAQGFHLGAPEALGPASWHVALPRRSLAARVNNGRVGRSVRPVALLVVAALLWPGIVAVAGLGGPPAGGTVEKPPATAPREDSGGSGARPSVHQPAAAGGVVRTPRLPSSAQPTSEPVHEEAPATGPVEVPVGGTLEEAADAVEDGGGLVHEVGDEIERMISPGDGPGLVGRILGH